MIVETREAIREKIAQSRRLLLLTTDPSTAESLRIYIEELEQLLSTAAGGDPSE